MLKEQTVHNRYGEGFQDGIPIGLGYLSVSFTFGMMAVNAGLPVWAGLLVSMTTLTSAGQFAGLTVMAAGGSMMEMALSQLIINLRYALMSLSLSQKLDRGVRFWERLVVAFGNTDEIFAVASGKQGNVGFRYLLGLITVPYFGWAAGTAIGGAVSMLLPEILRSALGIAIYGMFLAIIIPPAKSQHPVRKVLFLSAALSVLLRQLPEGFRPSGGFVIILCAVAASLFGAVCFPIREEADSE